MNDIIPKDNQDISEVKQGFVKTEVNFLQYPIGTLDKHYKGLSISYKEKIKEDLTIEWRIEGGGISGLPGPTAIELDNVISKLLQDKTRWINGEIPKWIKVPYYQLAKELGHISGGRVDGRTNKRIKKDLRKIGIASIISKRAFKEKGKTKWGELIFSKYQSIALKGESVPHSSGVPEAEGDEEGRASMVYIVLSDIYWNSLKVNYTKPINYKFMMSLKSAVLQRVYQLLSLGFQTRMSNDKNGIACLNYNYAEFCGRLPLKIWKSRYEAKRKLVPYLTKMMERGYLKKFEFEFQRSQDRWFIRFYPGSIALEELEVIQGQRLLFDQVAPQVEERKRLKRVKGWETNRKEREAKETENKKQEEEQREKEDQALWKKFESLPQTERETIRTQAEEQANRTRIFRRLGKESKREWIEGAISLILKGRFGKDEI